MEQTPTLLEAFKDNPVFMFFAVVFGLGALVLAVVGLVVRGKGLGIGLGVAAALVAFLAITVGAVGAIRVRVTLQVAAESAGLSSSDRGRVLEYGNAEAKHNLVVGAVAAVPGGALGLLAIVVALTRKA